MTNCLKFSIANRKIERSSGKRWIEPRRASVSSPGRDLWDCDCEYYYIAFTNGTTEVQQDESVLLLRRGTRGFQLVARIPRAREQIASRPGDARPAPYSRSWIGRV